MSYNTSYIFEGEYCRKPEQNLGGRSKPLPTRDAVVEKAAQERSRREVSISLSPIHIYIYTTLL